MLMLMKVSIERNRLKSVMESYIINIEGLILQPVVSAYNLDFHTDVNKLLFSIDLRFETVVCSVDYNFYRKMFSVFTLQPPFFHEILLEVLRDITGIDINSLIVV